MYTIIQIKNIDFVKKYLPGLALTEEKLARLRFPAIERLSGFVVKKILFFKRIKEVYVSTTENQYLSAVEKEMGGGDLFLTNDEGEARASLGLFN